MAAGLDVWPPEAQELTDARLASRLGVRAFKVPPQKPDKGVPSKAAAPLPYVRFPQWHFCPRCRALRKAHLHAPKRPTCDSTVASRRLGRGKPCGQLAPNRRPRVLPLRFVAVSEAGPIEDFPWQEWVHTPRGEALIRGQQAGKGRRGGGRQRAEARLRGQGRLMRPLVQNGITSCRQHFRELS